MPALRSLESEIGMAVVALLCSSSGPSPRSCVFRLCPVSLCPPFPPHHRRQSAEWPDSTALGSALCTHICLPSRVAPRHPHRGAKPPAPQWRTRSFADWRIRRRRGTNTTASNATSRQRPSTTAPRKQLTPSLLLHTVLCRSDRIRARTVRHIRQQVRETSHTQGTAGQKSTRVCLSSAHSRGSLLSPPTGRQRNSLAVR